MKLFSVVFQDFKLFAFSIKDNIVLNCSEQQNVFQDSITKAGISKYVQSLPRKEGTMLYKIFDEEGIEFSGGYNQKLALARALYKNSPIIILDEPSSALDPIAEYQLTQSMLENGKIIEAGSHEGTAEDEW